MSFDVCVHGSILEPKMELHLRMGDVRLQSKLILLCVCLMITIQHGRSATIDEVIALRSSLLSGYDKFVRPVTNQSDAVDVDIGLQIIALQEFDEVEEKFSFVGVFEISWTDEKLTWDPSNNSGIASLFMGYSEVWVPELILTNPSEKLDSFGSEWQFIRYVYNGTAYWYPGDLIKATCAVNAYYFPYDIQECTAQVFPWAYTNQEVNLIPTRDYIGTISYERHGSWSLIQTQAKLEIISYSTSVCFTFWFERKPGYVIINVILPVLFLSLLNVMVFMLPAESGERVSYSITVLLSIAVFLTIVSDTLPRTSEPLPIISYFLVISLVISAIITVAAILNLVLYYRDGSEPIPDCVLQFYRGLKNCCTCTKTHKRNKKRNSIDSEEYLEKKTTALPPLEIKSTSSKSSNKVGVMEPQLQELDDRFSDAEPVSWKEISFLVDVIMLIVTSSMTLINFAVYMIVTSTASIV